MQLLNYKQGFTKVADVAVSKYTFWVCIPIGLSEEVTTRYTIRNQTKRDGQMDLGLVLGKMTWMPQG